MLNPPDNERFHLTKKFRIEICGGIASGKTTLANLLHRLELEQVLEDFRANPFWKPFYDDPVGNAFETEITFLLQHYHQIKSSIKRGKAFVCDFSLLLDLTYANVTLHGTKREPFLRVYDEIHRELPLPDLLIHLFCDPSIEMERIHRRGRDVERSITLKYLSTLNEMIGRLVIERQNSITIFSIDSGRENFANDEQGKHDVLGRLASIMTDLNSAGHVSTYG